MAATQSVDDKTFLAICEEEFKDRYTEKDEEFMKVFNELPSKPPIMDPWMPNRGRRNDRRFNRRHHPYERYNNREQGRDRRDQRDHRDHRDSRGYNDYNSGGGSRYNRYQY